MTEHIYDNACDADCNECGATRTVKHAYDDPRDADCNKCGFIRELPTFVYAVHRGDTVTVSVALADGASIRTRGFGLDFLSAYDPAVFEPVEAKWSKTISENALLVSADLETGSAVFAAQNEFDITGEIFTLTLKVKEDAAFGDYDVNVILRGCDAKVTTAAISSGSHMRWAGVLRIMALSFSSPTARIISVST